MLQKDLYRLLKRVGEEVRIELGDYYGHWIEFTHDGEGRLVQLILGNELRLAPCEIR